MNTSIVCVWEEGVISSNLSFEVIEKKTQSGKKEQRKSLSGKVLYQVYSCDDLLWEFFFFCRTSKVKIWRLIFSCKTNNSPINYHPEFFIFTFALNNLCRKFASFISLVYTISSWVFITSEGIGFPSCIDFQTMN